MRIENQPWENEENKNKVAFSLNETFQIEGFGAVVVSSYGGFCFYFATNNRLHIETNSVVRLISEQCFVRLRVTFFRKLTNSSASKHRYVLFYKDAFMESAFEALLSRFPNNSNIHRLYETFDLLELTN